MEQGLGEEFLAREVLAGSAGGLGVGVFSSKKKTTAWAALITRS